MSSGYITTDKLKCKLGENFQIKGNVKKGVLPKFSYRVIIGSAAGETEIRSGLDSDDFSGNGITVNLGQAFTQHAYPYGDGKMCYIKAIGTRDPTIGSSETVEYSTYINLFGDLLPDYQLSFIVDNGERTDFGSRAIKGISKVTAKIAVNEPKFGEKISSAQFTGGIFSKTESGDKREFICEVDPINTAGEVFAFSAVTNNLGYQTSKSQSITVLDYKEPSLSFTEEPHRVDDAGASVEQVNDENKNGRHKLCFTGKVKPCLMKDGDTQICRISGISGAKIKRLDDTTQAVSISMNIGENADTDGSLGFSFENKPVFGEDDEGLQVYKAYELIITCTDSSERTYELKYRINTLGTAFHLKRGGRGAKFGGYATEDDLVESDWDIRGNKDIEAVGNLKGATLTVGESSITGFGSGETEAAKGNHFHGFINDKGQLCDENGVPVKKKLILKTDENGYIIGIEVLTSDDIYIGADSSMQKAAGIGVSGSVGTAETGFCFADHIHPYSDAWKNDEDYIALVNSVNATYAIAQKL